ncbi:ADP-ribose pyrophosphatase, mitochondrial-like [Anneissia japonica]|uniref:ADP-ribose pyrophosphatase, mitochondrial-like n=1 Tax=Anneissia japonica TaxID=1529436 RepID=UPI0014258F99|nr:ADP-ribose pyrophosphatase, mitochondrial-like [Anneissia japonica]
MIHGVVNSSSKRLLFLGNIFSQFLICDKMSLTTQSAFRVPLHCKARQSPYTGSKVKRFPVPEDMVPWSVEWPDYNPTTFTTEHVLSKPVWADPDISKNSKNKLKFNEIDGKVNRRSHMGKYKLQDSLPLNHAADPIVTRWKRTANNEKVKHSDGKDILQFVAIKRKDSGLWAIPGGMVDAGDTISATLKREFGEEAMNSLEATGKEKKAIEKEVAKLFRHGIEVYRGYVDDPRNTDNSWMETVAVNFHDDTGNSVGKFKLYAGDDAADVHWTDIGADLNLYASHISFIEKVATRLEAHW